MTMAGELKHGKRVEELKFTENVKKKTSNFVRKYMAKHDPSKAEYQRSPPPAPKDWTSPGIFFCIPGYLGISRDISGYLVDILKHHQHNRALNESQELIG